MPAHSQLTGSDLHEPKGVSGASSGTVYVADGSGSGAWSSRDVWTRIIKSSNTSRSSTTTLTADPDLQFSVLANSKYLLRGHLGISTRATPDFKFGMGLPAGGSMLGTYWAHPPNNSSPVMSFFPGTSVPDVISGNDTVTVGRLLLDCVVIIDSTAGTVSFNWAQNASSGTSTQVLANSYFEYLKIA